MNKFTDRTGEKNINNFGSEMIITEYRGTSDIDVYFPKYDWISKNTYYSVFRKGSIRCPYESTIYGIGYIGEGKYKVSKNNKKTKCYNLWEGMLGRCYNKKYHKKYPSYINCKVSKEWHNFQNFAKWYDENYYEIEGEKMCLDKDILVKGNKIYSPKTCVFVPNNINVLFCKRDKCRGEYPIGVSYDKQTGKFRAKCNIYNLKERKRKTINLKRYNTPMEAFNDYKQFKENYVKEVADYYKDKIPKKIYDAMYEYEVEITD